MLAVATRSAAPGRLRRRVRALQAEPRRDAGERRLRCRAIERQASAEEARGVDQPEREIAIGDGGLGAAAPIGDGARIGAGAVRPDLQHALRIDAQDRAAAGADRARPRRPAASSGNPPITVRVANCGSPSAETAMSPLVPPMSKVMMRGVPVAAASRLAAITPEAGPDSRVSTGRARAVARLSVPPFEAVMNTGAVTPPAREAFAKAGRNNAASAAGCRR